MNKCLNCPFKKLYAKLFDMHFDYKDCPFPKCVIKNNIDEKTEKKQ